ncbi:MAG: FAD-dependent oxidoreductase [Verrucomicrobiota bacterium]
MSETPVARSTKYAWSDVPRVEPPKRPASNRVADFHRVEIPYDEETASVQASRCILCPTPVCVACCPLEAPLVELLRLTADRQFTEAAELFFASHNIPEIASHTCLGGRQCERVCVLGDKTDPVPVRAITRFLLDYGWKHGLAEPAVAPSKEQSVAVLGSGIGGLVAADELSRRGYEVTVFDSRRNPGGRMMNGLPGFRMDTELVKRRIELLKQRGIRFRMGVNFGQEVKLSDLRGQFDAVFLGFGRAEPVPLDIPGGQLKGVHDAYAFMAGDACIDEPAVGVEVRGKRVVVLGAGDTAMDALRMAIRYGAAEAVCVYRRDSANLPADAEEYANAVEEGARFLFLSQPVALLGSPSGRVNAIRCRRVELVTDPGALRPEARSLPDADFEIPADVVLVAYGFTAPRLPAFDDFQRVTADAQGRVEVDENRMTSLPGVFAGGSLVRGPVPLVEVVRDARNAVASMDRYLKTRRAAP